MSAYFLESFNQKRSFKKYEFYPDKFNIFTIRSRKISLKHFALRTISLTP